MGEWRDIASAPRGEDETMILAWGPLHDCMVVSFDPTSRRWLVNDGPEYGEVFTHWMPLPEPPAASAESKARLLLRMWDMKRIAEHKTPATSGVE